ncbi:hypothetical protein ACP6JD_000171 [Aspergillus fumigatus]
MTLPSNVHVSSHPCLQAKLSQLRSHSTSPRETRSLVHDIATILGVEAFAAGLKAASGGKAYCELLLNHAQAINDLLPTTVPIYHLGLFRDKFTLQPVEYYNNLPFLRPDSPTNSTAATLAILLDPIIATGATAEAAIQLLREWGVQRVIMLSVLGSKPGLRRAAECWPEGVEVWVGAVDEQCDERGMIVPGVGDIGDRLFLAIGK